ncbi:unnamed protein product, partial [Acanthoscelides obtectus]
TKQNLIDGNTRHFPVPSEKIPQSPLHHVEIVSNLKDNFKNRFKDFNEIPIVAQFVVSPFMEIDIQQFATSVTQNFSEDIAATETEVIPFQNDLALKSLVSNTECIWPSVRFLEAVSRCENLNESSPLILAVCKDEYHSVPEEKGKQWFKHMRGLSDSWRSTHTTTAALVVGRLANSNQQAATDRSNRPSTDIVWNSNCGFGNGAIKSSRLDGGPSSVHEPSQEVSNAKVMELLKPHVLTEILVPCMSRLKEYQTRSDSWSQRLFDSGVKKPTKDGPLLSLSTPSPSRKIMISEWSL